MVIESIKDIPVDYDDSKHLYSFQQQKYTSASQLVEKFTTPFNTIEVATRYAAKNGMTPEYWIEQWKQKNDASKVRGNYIHDANELALQGRMIDVFNGQQIPVQGEAIQEVTPWIERPDGVYTEAKLWHHGYKIAGRADKIILLTEFIPGYESPTHKTIFNKYAHIEDYKTNERLDMESFTFKNGSKKMMRPPIAHIQDCNWYHYCLQLSTYMLMLEYQGFLPGTMTITHFPHPTAEEPNPQKKKYDVPYMKKEVVLMCNFLNK